MRRGCSGRATGALQIRRPDPAGALVAVLATVLSLGPTLLPLSPVVQGAVCGIVAAHGYLVGMLVWAMGRWLVAWFGAGPVSVAAAARWAGGALVPVRALRGRGSAVLAVLGLVAGGLVVPGAPAVSESAILGREGLRFLAGSPSAAQIAAVAGGPAIDPLRVYIGTSTAGTITERVGLAVAELERAGGFTRSAVLVAVPTGSGWVNPAAVQALEHLMRGDLATVVVQYAARPSWQEYVGGAAEAERSATALVGALQVRLAVAGPHRPRLLVYGESLGALAALPAVATVDAALLAGLPAAAWDPAAGPPARTVLHFDDPVGWWSPRLLVQRPEGWPGRWFPVVTFWQVTGSLLGAVGAPPGHGHRYGGELVDAWRSVGFGTALPPDGPVAVRAAIDPAFATPAD